MKKSTIKAIIKEPNKPAELREVANTLKGLQAIIEWSL